MYCKQGHKLEYHIPTNCNTINTRSTMQLKQTCQCKQDKDYNINRVDNAIKTRKRMSYKQGKQ